MKFYTKKNRLTEYGLACGYIEKKKQHGISTTLWSECHIYHVRQHDYKTGKRIFWESFDSIKEARNLYNKA